MTEEETTKWAVDAIDALLKVYTLGEAQAIVRWFVEFPKHGGISDLVGILGEKLSSDPRLWAETTDYNRWMSKMWMWAPRILRDARENGTLVEPVLDTTQFTFDG